MAKQDYFFRYLLIIRKLRTSGRATFREIVDFLTNNNQWYDFDGTISLRTFQRDIQEIRNLFQVMITYNFSDKTWFIEEDDRSGMNNRMLESLDTLHSLGMANDMAKYLLFEKRKSQGTHHLSGLISAIRDHFVIELTHQKFDGDTPSNRQAAPYALKESRGRWYLVAKDLADKRIKAFGLDRIIAFTTTVRVFDYPAEFDVNEHFRYCFGVINPDHQQPEKIILSFDAEQGKYIKSYPLHESQEILLDQPDELQISVYLYLTYDLIQEILSYGNRVKVVSPATLLEKCMELSFKGC